MSNIKDLLNNPVTKNTSLAYILLLTNVLGVAAYLESKTIQQKVTISQESEKPKKEILNIQNQQSEVQQEQEEYEESPNKSICIEQTFKAENEEIKTPYKDNVIDFKEAVALKAKETKQPIKALVWRFPN